MFFDSAIRKELEQARLQLRQNQQAEVVAQSHIPGWNRCSPRWQKP